uniref:Uncharacterized protein n=1 Tax=Arundo donax TaxID=35708 RepID=A0A0A9GYC9_ARUDO
MLIFVRTCLAPTPCALPEVSIIWLDASMPMTRAPSRKNSFWRTKLQRLL